MKVFTFEAWHGVDSWQTEAGNFVGLAIGAESHEAIVRVGDTLLQAGRVLPVRSSGAPYTVTRHRVPKSQFTELSKLQLYAFECIEELAGDYTRAVTTFSTGITGTDLTGVAWTTTTTALNVPFRGRRQAMVSLSNADVSDIGMLIKGRRYNASKRAIEVATLVTVNPGDFTGTCMGVHVGGTNDAEAWDALRIELGQTAAGDLTAYVDVECIGELGAR